MKPKKNEPLPSLSKAEWEVMKPLWEQGAMAARDVFAALPDGHRWAYRTVKTMLSRLVAKGALREQKEANTSLYSPVLSQHKARSSALRSLANQAFDGAFGPLVHFLMQEQTLSDTQRRELIAALRRRQPKGPGK